MAQGLERIESFAKPTATDRASLDAQLVREQGWYGTTPRYATNDTIVLDRLNGNLTTLKADANLQPARRFYDMPERFLPYVTPQAHFMMTELGFRWRGLLDAAGLDYPDVRLSIGSMIRSIADQQKIVQAGKLAVLGSTHCTGNAVDVDGGAYYIMDDEGMIACGPPERREKQQEVKAALALVNPEMAAGLRYSYDYDPRVIEGAWTAAQAMHDEGRINLVREMEGTPSACLHMAANPAILTLPAAA